MHAVTSGMRTMLRMMFLFRTITLSLIIPATVRTARSAYHRQGDAFDEDGNDQEGAAEQSEDAEGEERAQDTILEGRRQAESAELGGDPNRDVDSDQRSDDPEGRRVVDPGGADQRSGGEDARQPGEEDVFGRNQSGFE